MKIFKNLATIGLASLFSFSVWSFVDAPDLDLDHPFDSSARIRTIHGAASEGSIRGLTSFLKNGVDIDAERGKLKMTPLHIASARGHLDMVQFLIAEGASLNKKSAKGLMPVHFASGNGQLEVMEFLMEAMANRGMDKHPSTSNVEGWTPLHYAVFRNNLNMAKILIKRHGADVNAITKDGRTPLDLALSTKGSLRIPYLSKALLWKHDERTQKMIDLIIQNGGKREWKRCNIFVPCYDDL